MADQAERVILEAEDQVTPIVGRANASLGSFEGKAESSHGKVIRITDQTRSSVQRLITSLEKQAETYGKSGVEKLIAQRDQLLQRYAKEPALIDAITKSYEKMIAAQKELNATSAAAAEGGSGFNARYAFFGVKDIMEGRTKFALAEAANELMRLRGGLLGLGIGVAIIAGIAFAAYELHKQLKELAEQPDKILAAFREMNGALQANADQLRAENTHLENTIAKLEHKPQNLLAEALDDARLAANELSKSLNQVSVDEAKALESANVGAFGKVMGYQGVDDVKEWLAQYQAAKQAVLYAGQQNIHGAIGQDAAKEERQKLDQALAAMRRSALGRMGRFIEDTNNPPGQVYHLSGDAQYRQGRLNALYGLTAGIANEQEISALTSEHTTLSGRAKALQANAAANRGGESESKKWDREAAAFEKKGDEAELDAIGKIYYARDQLLTQGEKLKKSEEALAHVRADADKQVAAIYDPSRAAFLQYDETRERFPLDKLPLKNQLKDWSAGFAAQDRIEDIGVQAQKAELQRQAAKAARMAELGGGSDEEIAQRTYRTRINLALQLAGIETARIAKEDDANKKSVMAAQARKDLFAGLSEAQDQFDEKQAQTQQKLRQQREQELQSQIDGLQKQAGHLFDVLFTKPKNFAKDLGSTIHAAVLKPVVETLSSGAANLLHPLIYGKDGNGGINGLFHPNQDPVTVATHDNTSATIQNSTAIMLMTAHLAAAMGVAPPPAITSSGIGPASISVPSISMQAPSMPSFFSGGAQSMFPGISFGRNAGPSALSFPWLGSGGQAGGSSEGGRDYGTTDANGLPLSSIARPSSFGGSSRGGSNILGTFGGLKSEFSKDNWWNNSIYTGAGRATTAAGIGGIKGDLAAALTSKGAGQVELAAGMPLAMAGLTGGRRGTWGGIAESTGGGALVGAGIGTMIMPGIGTAIGAGIGAAAGFVAGGLEKLVGIKSDAQKVHDDVKSIYGVDLPVNSGTVKQIVSLAQSQYGGNIAVAVRSPSVRQLVMLYSEATGQKTPLSSTTPYAGSLVEQGGNLYQQATYQDGQAHTYASNIPTLGGIASSSYPTPGGPNTSSGTGVNFALNINGTPISPEFVADSSMAAQNSSYGRTQQAANLQVPGLMTGT